MQELKRVASTVKQREECSMLLAFLPVTQLAFSTPVQFRTPNLILLPTVGLGRLNTS